MTAASRLPPPGKPAYEDVNDHIPTSRKQRQAFVDLPVLNSIRRTTPASRPYGRCAVGLRPSLDSDAYFDVPSQDQEAPKTSESKRSRGLDRPRSFRNELHKPRCPRQCLVPGHANSVSGTRTTNSVSQDIGIG